MLRRLYDRTMQLAAHRHAEPILAGVSFAESSVFPIPPDVMMLPMMLAEPKRAWRIALIATLASVAGGFLGYAIGALLYEAVGQPLLAFYGYEDKFEKFADAFAEWGWWIVFGAGLTPFPYKVITIASGVAGLWLPVFGIASVVGRGMRFFLLALLLYYFGPPVRTFVERYLSLLTVLFFVLLLGGFLVLKVL